jgi:hypothetical protein
VILQLCLRNEWKSNEKGHQQEQQFQFHQEITVMNDRRG